MIELIGGGTKNTVSVSDLEKHLNDVKKGKGYLSKDIPYGLFKAQTSSADILSQRDPTSFGLYQSYLTTFSYDNRARFISGIERAAKTLNKLI